MIIIITVVIALVLSALVFSVRESPLLCRLVGIFVIVSAMFWIYVIIGG